MLDDLKAKYRSATTFSFGNGPRMANDFLELVVLGRKTASCGALRDYDGAARLPVAGQYFIVNDGRRKPGAVIRVTQVTVRSATEVTEEFALATGEFSSREEWFDDLVSYFGGYEAWTEDTPLVCWRFELVEVLTDRSGMGDLVAWTQSGAPRDPFDFRLSPHRDYRQ